MRNGGDHVVSVDLRGLATGPPTGVGGGLGQFPAAGASCSSDFVRQTRQVICSVHGYTTQGSVITYVIAPGFLSVSNPRFLDKSDVSDRIPRLRVFDLKSLENKNL